jgi:serine/threonine protein kinase
MQFKEKTLFDDRYLLIKLLGKGGFSEVWLVEDRKVNDKPMVVKVYAPGAGLDEDGIQIFKNEFVLLFDIHHSNLLKPAHFDICDNMPYLVLPYCEQGSCNKLIGKITEEEAWKFLHDVAAGLAHLHAQEPPVIHQDIKPANILMDNGSYLITDFGISTKARSTLRKSVSQSLGGTIAYMSPEKFGPESLPVKAGDIWALGATLYELITGNVPFGEQGGLIQKNGAEIPNVHGTWSSGIIKIINSCLAKDPWDRPVARDILEQAEYYLNPAELTKTCAKCGAMNKEDERICKSCGKKFRDNKSTLKWICGLAAACVLIVVSCFFLFNNNPLEPVESRTSCDTFQPLLEAKIKKSAIAVFGDSKNGVNTYVIRKDDKNNWEIIKSDYYKYGQEREYGGMDINLLIRDELDHNPDEKNYVCYAKDSLYVKKIISNSRIDNSLKIVEKSRDDYYLFSALAPSDYRSNSCMIKIERNKTVFCWLSNTALQMEYTEVGLGYASSNNPGQLEADFRNFIKNNIPQEHRAYFFTTGGYDFKELDESISRLYPSENFLLVKNILQNQINNPSENVLKIFEMYKAILSAMDTGCFLYRKAACPAIGYLLVN